MKNNEHQPFWILPLYFADSGIQKEVISVTASGKLTPHLFHILEHTLEFTLTTSHLDNVHPL